MASDGDYRGDAVIVATVFGLLLPFVAVSLRLAARGLYTVRFYLLAEDYLIIAALVFKIGLDIAGIILLENGMGRHITQVPPSQLIVFVKTQYSGSFLYPLCIACVKLSVLMQYRRMFSDGSRSFRIQIYILMAVVILWCLSILITACMICVPIQKLWEVQVEGTCLDLTAFYYGMQIPNVLTDIFMIVCPIRMILSLDLPRRLQAAAIAMFLLGISTLVFDIIRLVILIQLSNSTSPDITYNEVDAAVWTTIEPAIAIVTVCIPSIRSLHRRAVSRNSVVRKDMRHTSTGSELELQDSGANLEGRIEDRHSASVRSDGDGHEIIEDGEEQVA